MVENLLDTILKSAESFKKEFGLTENQATKAALIIIRDVQKEFGGRSAYVHLNNQNRKKTKILKLWSAGTSISDIVKKTKISKTHIYHVIKNQKKS